MDAKLERTFIMLEQFLYPTRGKEWILNYDMRTEIAYRLRVAGRLIGQEGAAFDIRQETATWHIKPVNKAAEEVLKCYEQYVIEKELQKG